MAPQTRPTNASKHPGLPDAETAKTKAPRRTPAQMAEARLLKEEKKTAIADKKVAKAERLDDVTAMASAEDAAYTTPVPPKAKRRKAPTQKEGMERIEAALAQATYEMDMESPLPPVTYRRDVNVPSNAQVRRTEDVDVPAKLKVSAKSKGAATKIVAPAAEAARPEDSSDRPVGYRVRPPRKAPVKSQSLEDFSPGEDAELQDTRSHRVPLGGSHPKPDTSGANTGASRSSNSRQRKGSIILSEDSATEEDSQAPIEVLPPKKTAKKADADVKGKGKRVVQESSDVEVVEEEKPLPKKAKKADADVKGKGKKVAQESDVEVIEEEKPLARKERKTAENAQPLAKVENRKKYPTLNDKMIKPARVAVVADSNQYLKPRFLGTNEVASWSSDVPNGYKPSSQRTTSTPSLVKSESVTSRASSATRPPPSVLSQTSAMSNGIKVFRTADNKIMEHGAISDRDETQGEEYEAKKRSPMKGGQRLTSAHKVKVEPGMPAPLVAAPKASRQSNQKVPERFLEGAKWKNSVIPSMIKWAGTQSHIFKIQPERMIDTFEAVCRFYYEDNTISFTVRDPIFATVSQRLTDQFRSPTGSAAVAILLAFLASCPEKQNSNAKRVTWCQMMLDDFRFIYGQANGSKIVRWKRPFQSGLIIQTFAVYITATKEVPWILGMYPNSEDRDTSAPEPRPALALAAAAMERALTYVAEGRITLATIEAEKIKMKDAFLITADLTVAGKRAPASVAFSDELWGAEVKGYLSTIKGLRRGDISKIVTEARKFSRVTRPHSYNNNDDDDDEAPAHQGAQNSRARIPLNYNDDDDDDEEEEGHYDVDGNGSENGETEDRKPGVGIRGGQPSLPPQDYEDEDEDEEEAKVSVSPQRLKRYRDDEEMYEVPAHRTRYMDDDEDANSICYSEGHALEVNENDYEDEEMESW
ncbi:hypothetical protein FIBSPDRAFT_887558 [Athelia psychrophila]|uniref:DUF6532 domain-containing protein n=1 Tax=Athelia psychrophila TaxID=1759441 RepID=A0A166PKP1_9AGAM|nr:hypothetical protein FIBSPDRAFT_887558 [Fibularhizoctonia sp. CBS 109695]